MINKKKDTITRKICEEVSKELNIDLKDVEEIIYSVFQRVSQGLTRFELVTYRFPKFGSLTFNYVKYWIYNNNELYKIMRAQGINLKQHLKMYNKDETD